MPIGQIPALATACAIRPPSILLLNLPTCLPQAIATQKQPPS
ncbi:hypothetical protein [Desulfonatronum thiodismutans]|nr:hypothetical protein [Desulfonatronum thiodismutans]